MNLLFCVLCGGFLLRAVGQVNLWLDGDDYINRPLFLTRHRNTASVLVLLAIPITYASAVIIGWLNSRWIGTIIGPLLAYLSHIVLGLLIDKRFPLRITHSRPLNPINHLLVLPCVLLILTIWALLHRHA